MLCVFDDAKDVVVDPLDGNGVGADDEGRQVAGGVERDGDGLDGPRSFLELPFEV